MQQVRQGERLGYDLLDPFQLAEPRADRVVVRWVAANPPTPFKGRAPHGLTYLGQNAGTSVFLDTEIRPQAIYRFPTSAVTVQTSAVSLLD